MLLSGGYEPFWVNNEEKTIKRTLHMEIKYLQILSPSANTFLSGLLGKKNIISNSFLFYKKSAQMLRPTILERGVQVKKKKVN